MNYLRGAWDKERKTDEYKELNLETGLTLNSFTFNNFSLQCDFLHLSCISFLF